MLLRNVVQFRSKKVRAKCIITAQTEKTLHTVSFLFVRGRGLEPPRLAAHAPQACLATSYSTRAFFHSFIGYKIFKLRNACNYYSLTPLSSP